MTGPTRGPDDLTARDHMRLFDSLPKAIRRVLTDAPYNYDPRDILNVWYRERYKGRTAQQVAREIWRNAQLTARQHQEQELDP